MVATQENIDFQKENKKLNRKIKLLEQSLEQFGNIKKKYDDLILKLNDKDEKLLEANINLEEKVLERTQELQNYIDAINNVAMVIEFDNDFNILSVNETFIKKSGYKEEELLKLNLDDILEGSRSNIFLKELKESLSKSEIVKYSNRFLNKNNEEFFLKNAYFTIDEKNKKHMVIGFSVTNETLEKKEFNKKVIEKIREANSNDLKNKKTIANMTLRLEQYETYLKSLKKDTEILKEKLIIKNRQIISFEEQLATIDKKYQNIIASKNKEMETYSRTIHTLRTENEKLHDENDDLKRAILKLQKEAEK